jgi:thymidylate synthase
MKQYLDLLKDILENGESRDDRTETGVLSSFGHQLRFNLQDGFPAVTTKKLAWKGELGYANSETVKKLGPIYGVQWRNWGGKDQIQELIDGLRSNPMGRRHILSAWNVEKIDEMALPPCHVMSQFYVSTNGRLSCQMYQRSADMFLGVPFNIASYALLLSILANILNLEPGDFVHTFGDAHIYKNSIEQAKEQIAREPKKLPSLIMPNIESVEDLETLSIDDFILDGYDSHPAIKAPMAI